MGMIDSGSVYDRKLDLQPQNASVPLPKIS